jgi:hypothetical protein
MNRKGIGRNRLGLILSSSLSVVWRDWGKTPKTPVRIACFWAEIGTGTSWLQVCSLGSEICELTYTTPVLCVHFLHVVMIALPLRYSTSLSVPCRHVGGADISLQFRLFLTWTLDGCEWSTSRPGRFTPLIELRYPLNRRLGGPQRRSWRFGEEKNPLPGFEPNIVQPLG